MRDSSKLSRFEFSNCFLGQLLIYSLIPSSGSNMSVDSSASSNSSDKQPSPLSLTSDNISENAINDDIIKSEFAIGDPDSGDEVPIRSPSARILDVRCGNLTGRLYEERFTCPGIHRRCIEFEGELIFRLRLRIVLGKLISPRQFTIKAEKDKQKDWKGSIRVGRYNLRYAFLLC